MKKTTLIIIAVISVVVLAIIGWFIYDWSISEETETPIDAEKVAETNENYNREFVAKDVWGNVPAIAVDKNDIPHVAFYNREFGDLIYATKINGQWKYEIVDDEGDVGTEKGIAVSSEGIVHIAYKDTTNGDTKYAVGRFGSWEISFLEEVPDTHHTVFVDLELDSQDIPHVVYHTELNEGMDEDKYDMSIVKYAVLKDSKWEIEQVAPIGQFTQLAIDGNDKPHILYVIEPEEKTIHAYKENNKWIHKEIDPSAGNRRDIDISIDRKTNTLHAIYHDTDAGLIKYYRHGGEGDELIETIDSGLSTEGLGHKGIKLGVGPKNIPHVVYFSQKRGGFVHAVRSDERWTFEIINQSGYPAIAVDSQERAHIAHTFPLKGPREMAPEVVEREEDDLEQIVYQLVD